jgi:glucan phosphoethanolaminetransferase (alkaline phosphatase superfamily)
MRVIQAVAVILTALALVPGGAHLAEMSTKLTLDREQYFVVQQIYRGWALFGAILFAGFFVNLVMAVLLWRRRQRFILPAIACLAIAASLITFFILVYPTNVATNNWTKIPVNWEELRTRWEFGHMAGTVLIFVALCAVAFTPTDCKRITDD